MRFLVAAIVVVTASGMVTAADQWPQFRGPNAGVVADDPGLPDTWSETENVVWKIDVPGLGWSSPIVWDDHIFLTSAISAGKEPAPVAGLYDEHDHVKAAAAQRWMVYDIDFKTGKIRWERELHQGAPPLLRHIKNSYASETPVTDGERVYVYFGSIGLVAALDFNGNVVWTKNVGAFNTQVELGTGASPVLYKDRLFIVNDNTTQSFLIAFEARTGKELWRVDREERGNWSTPVIWENELRTEIVTTGTIKIRSYDLDGKLLWELSGMSTLTIPSPFVKHGLVFISSGYPGGALRPVYAIRPGAHGDISLKPDETTQRVRRLVPAAARDLQHVGAGLRRQLLHAARSRLPAGARRAHRQADLRAAADLGRFERLHDVAVGLQREDLPAERGRRHLRRPGGSGIQAARQELAQRDAAGHAGGGARQPDRPHPVEDVSHRERGAPVIARPEACGHAACAWSRSSRPARSHAARAAPLHKSPRFPAPPISFEVHGNRAYVVGHGSLRIFDIANLRRRASSVPTPSPRRSGASKWSDPLIYVAADFYGLGILDVSNPAAPRLRGSLKTPGQAKNVAVVGTKAAIADHMSGVDFVDISNADKPTMLGSFYVEGYAREVAAFGSMAYAVDAPTGVYVFDMTQPGALEPVHTQQTATAPGMIVVSDPKAARPNLAVLVGGGSLQVYDLTKPSAPGQGWRR